MDYVYLGVTDKTKFVYGQEIDNHMKQDWRINLQLMQSTGLTFPYTHVLTPPGHAWYTVCRFDRFRFIHLNLTVSRNVKS